MKFVTLVIGSSVLFAGFLAMLVYLVKLAITGG